ncbi:MAG: hypothetical protein LEGION0398_MBIBDBAK_00139 [Legionellaceae bacterium]
MLLFWLGIGFLVILALGFIIYPFMSQYTHYSRYEKWSVLGLILAIPFISLFLYYQWGYSKALKKHYVVQEEALKLRQQIKNPQEIIQRLKQHLQEKPQSPEGWYLLGKLYASLGEFEKASQVYAKLIQIEENNPDYIIQYAQTLYFANQYKMNTIIQQLIKKTLTLNPENALAINLLAIDAYRNKFYEKAIQYWEKVIHLYPPSSEDYQIIAAAMQRAQQHLQKKDVQLFIDVALNEELKNKITGNEIVFIYAREFKGSAMPLAITRIKAEQLPKRILLTNDMAMSPDKNLSHAKKVLVIARISKTGQAMPTKGDLTGVSKVVTITDKKPIHVTVTVNEILNK